MSQLAQWSPVIGAMLGTLVFIAWRFRIGYHPPGTKIPVFQPSFKTESLLQFTLEARARVIWAGTMIFLWAAILGAVLVSAWVLHERDIACHSAFLSRTIIPSLITMPVFCLFRWGGEETKSLLKNIVIDKKGIGIGPVIVMANAMAVVGCIFLIAGFVSTLALPPGNATLSIRFVADQVENARTLLYLGSALCTMGTVESWALHSWGAASVAAEQQTIARSLAETMAMYAGVFYSLLLILAYIPTVSVLQARTFLLELIS